MTKKSDTDDQGERWRNRLAFLGGITSTDEKDSILKDDPDEEDDELVPAPVAATPRRRGRGAARWGVNTAQKRRKREAAKEKTKREPPKKESPSALARTEVKKLVNRYRDDVLRKAMPGIALNLYREARELLNELESGAPEFEFQRVRWTLQAAVDAFELAERYSDAAEVLLFTARWAIRVNSRYDENTKRLIDQARALLDPKKDRNLLADCDELELMYIARRVEQ